MWDNLVSLFFAQADRLGERPFLWKSTGGQYECQTWREIAARVSALARGLRHLGVGRGDRVVIVAENRPGWLISDLAIMAAGGITVPAFTTNTPDQHRYILGHSGARGVIVSSRRLAERVLAAFAHGLQDISEISSIQLHAGAAAPFNFNGLVRHYFFRQSPELGDLQINLAPKQDRSRDSHAIALDVRKRLAGLPVPQGTVVRVVEVPPGPPVLATLLAEIYGPDAPTRRAVAAEVRKIFASVPFIVDVDDSFGAPTQRLRLKLDQSAIDFFRAQPGDVTQTVGALMNGVVIGYSHRGEGRPPVEIRMTLPRSGQVWNTTLEATPIPLNALPGDRAIAARSASGKADRQWFLHHYDATGANAG